MIAKAAILWDEPGTFNRFVNECCGICCDHVNQHLIASPFYRGRYVALVVPTGFGNPRYSRLLPGLRAAAPRIRRFVENGGRLWCSEPQTSGPAPSTVLPSQWKYRHEYIL